MAHFKVIRRRSKERSDGTAPLALRISKNYKTSYLFLGQYIMERDWNSKLQKVKNSHPYAQRLNNFLMEKIIKANELIFKLDSQVSAQELKQRIKGSYSPKTFFEVASERIKRKYDEGIFSVAKSELSIMFNIEEFLNLKKSLSKKEIIKGIKRRRKERISKTVKREYTFHDGVKHFMNNKRLKFHKITPAFLNRYKSFCAAYLKQKERTTSNNLVFIRTLYNIAIKEGIILQKHYPFGGNKIKIKSTSGNKIGLNKEEIKLIEALELKKGSFTWHTKNIWLVSFYFAGIRISDVLKLKWSDFKGDRLYYIMHKNKKPLSLKIPEKAKLILEEYKPYKSPDNDLIFPLIHCADLNDDEDIYRKIKSFTKRLNDHLKIIAKKCSITKNLSNHIARHSFGNIAGDKIHPLMLQKLYRHSNLKTTLNYQANFIHKNADDALDNVVDF